jgi:hypothetical protein
VKGAVRKKCERLLSSRLFILPTYSAASCHGIALIYKRSHAFARPPDTKSGQLPLRDSHGAWGIHFFLPASWEIHARLTWRSKQAPFMCTAKYGKIIRFVTCKSVGMTRISLQPPPSATIDVPLPPARSAYAPEGEKGCGLKKEWGKKDRPAALLNMTKESSFRVLP